MTKPRASALDDEPKIKAAQPTPAAVGPKMIQIPSGKPGVTGPTVAHDPFKYWSDYYKRKDESPAQFLETLTLLRREQKLDDVEACLRGYLTHRNKLAEPWMYEMLAVSVERRKGSPEEVKTVLGYASVLAMRSKNPNHLLSVADMLHLRGIYDKVGPTNSQTTAAEMIDLTAKAVPHRVEPLAMSMQVATKTKDPIRMADTAEKILSLGWPGADEPMRRDTRAQVDAMAKALREDGREKEAEALLAKLTVSLSRDIYIRLSWEGVDDIDLVVDEPLGATAQLFKMPRTVFGGAIVTNGFGKHPQEIYVCPRAFSGSYTIRVDKIFQPDVNPAKVASLEIITREGTAEEKRETRTIDLTKPEPVIVKLEGGRRKDVLPFLVPSAVKPASVVANPPKNPAEAKPAAKTRATIKP